MDQHLCKKIMEIKSKQSPAISRVELLLLTLPCHQRGEPPHRASRHSPHLSHQALAGFVDENWYWKLKLRSMFSISRMPIFGLNMSSTKIFDLMPRITSWFPMWWPFKANRHQTTTEVRVFVQFHSNRTVAPDNRHWQQVPWIVAFWRDSRGDILMVYSLLQHIRNEHATTCVPFFFSCQWFPMIPTLES